MFGPRSKRSHMKKRRCALSPRTEFEFTSRAGDGALLGHGVVGLVSYSLPACRTTTMLCPVIGDGRISLYMVVDDSDAGCCRGFRELDQAIDVHALVRWAVHRCDRVAAGQMLTLNTSPTRGRVFGASSLRRRWPARAPTRLRT